ncbi:ATP-grasp fold amidoligase family protein [Anaerosalibacter massiliensis]|uniref:ATP-grasp fold amidoligase family protein n=1 Tax=Anaerosalibacter massiliensis TaxID=1347392 RepID=UPI0006794149|nr:ATP-grasp fold amidoligase family protein [Anaerosalibacter massiliensis]
MKFKEKLKKSSLVKSSYKNSIKILSRISPKAASKFKYFISFGKKLDLQNPKTFNEKLMWIKIFEDDSIKSMCTDKYEVRNYIKSLDLEDILVDLYSVYDKVEDIKFDELPKSFVLKCTHGCGCNIVCPDKNKFNKEDAVVKLKKWMKTNYSLASAEPHYAKITPRIIVERFLGTEEGILPIDYKIHCFHGEPQMVEVVLDRTINEKKFILLDNNWNVMPYNKDSLNFHGSIKKPKRIDEMFEIARKLSNKFTYVRVDLYYYDDKIYFGELTFTPCACCDTDILTDSDYEIGKLLDLKKSFKLRSVKQN